MLETGVLQFRLTSNEIQKFTEKVKQYFFFVIACELVSNSQEANLFLNNKHDLNVGWTPKRQKKDPNARFETTFSY